MKLLCQIAFCLFCAIAHGQSEKIKCVCTIYNERDTTRQFENIFNVSIEELTQVPPLSETFVDYMTNYHLEEDSSGKVTKMIRTNYYNNTTQEITYICDSNNRLICEDIFFYTSEILEEHSMKSGKPLSYRREKIVFTYDTQGRRIGKVRLVIYDAGNEFVLEDCFYSY